MAGMRTYTPDFRRSALAMVASEGLSVRNAVARLGIPYHTLDGWVRKSPGKRRVLAPTIAPNPLVEAEARVRALEAEVRRLTLEKDILKKAAVSSTGQRNTRLNSRSGSICEVRIHP